MQLFALSLSSIKQQFSCCFIIIHVRVYIYGCHFKYSLWREAVQGTNLSYTIYTLFNLLFRPTFTYHDTRIQQMELRRDQYIELWPQMFIAYATLPRVNYYNSLIVYVHATPLTRCLLLKYKYFIYSLSQFIPKMRLNVPPIPTQR